MQIIPVIDLKEGLVVAARQGRRDRYQPICTPLCRCAEPVKVIRSILTLHEFTTFYIADLDAIMQKGHHTQTITALTREFPHLHFWLDSGLSVSAAPLASNKHSVTPVIGTENQHSAIPYALPSHWILSLDYLAGQPLGHPDWFTQVQLWPQRIMLMNLDRVGSRQGPAFNQLDHLRRHYPDKRIIAAGGVRNLKDLQTLSAIGIEYSLISTALHNGTIKPADLEKL